MIITQIRTFSLWCCAALVLFLSARDANALVAWERVSHRLYDNQILSVAVHPENADHVYAGVRGGVFEKKAGQEHWRQLLRMVISQSNVWLIHIDEHFSERIYVGSDEGLFFSKDGGRKWENIFSRFEAQESRVRSLLLDSENDLKLWVGTERGLYQSLDHGLTWIRVPELADVKISQLDYDHEGNVYAATSQGLYEKIKGSNYWRVVQVRAKHEESGSSQFGVEEFTTLSAMPFAFYVNKNGGIKQGLHEHITVFEPNGILRDTRQAGVWERQQGESILAPTNKVVAMSASQDRLAIPTEAGLISFDSKSGDIQSMNLGLAHQQVNDVAYDSKGDTIYIATNGGVYKLGHPTMSLYLNNQTQGNEDEIALVLQSLQAEPSIHELHQKAMRYAEVHPEKISEWRNAAKLKPWIPEVNVAYDVDSDEVIELDRGGTKDPDQFIHGPSETDTSWSLDMSWDLSELVWNPAQTSIDNRSKLMVQLREDLLSQLTHIYFARRRLQIQNILSPPPSLEKQFDIRLQIDEFTAGIDALTGGYLSRNTKPQLHVDKSSS